ncbi:polysaccharide biosynthesis protein [Parabacteroides sp. AM58-2XD]|uniref:UDP-N-acetylglucosamine 4,6-dehydratase family protein n=1 Tax=Bacteroidales TaxID=171549 RepID=UPI000FE18520|nr:MULTISPECIES: nucleoside-diphosphate sugar epimerase/dehydratase [Parabacteroides]RGY90661.1 polysaccharide biosynthesis protein [Parabacteroides sp. AM58-2XD]GKG75328.1 capsular polysaccharide biosynthesis protein CapD [Parabacteroides goldsteinii]GKG81265.1 capsular polysaccharide biosynthesis protein CapD [Parabacteroides goldsteinii]
MNINGFALVLSRVKFFNRWIVLFIDLFLSILATSTSLSFLWYILGTELVDDSLFHILSISFCCSLVSFFLCQTYKGVIRHSAFTETGRLALSSLIKVLFIVVLVYLTTTIQSPRELALGAVVDLFLTFFLLTILRVFMIVFYTIIVNSVSLNQGKLLIYQGDKSGTFLFDASLSDKLLYKVCGFLRFGDHTCLRVGKYRIYSIKKQVDFNHLVNRKNIKAVLFTDYHLVKEESERLVRYCEKKKVRMLMLPSVDELKKGKVNFRNLPEVHIEDLLGREEICINMTEIATSLKGKVVLVTGAAGSIGSELCRQLCTFNLKQLILFDSAETPMHNIRLELEEKFPQVEFAAVMGDIRMIDRVESLFLRFQPQYVFHAAAYKHVPLMEENPCEAVHTNVYGTRNVADMAVKYNVDKFIMISTDKAVNPTNVMGASKRLAEIYVQSLSIAISKGLHPGKTRFITTRFGNVLGSNGSVIPRFREQLAKGGPLTVTHPDIIRYFMTIPEACRLVLEAAFMGKGNEIFVFDMGTPVKIADLARRMIELAGLVPGEDIEIQYTGLRPGEKLYEELLATKENVLPTENEKIYRAQVREYDYDDICTVMTPLIDLAIKVDKMETVRMMKGIVPEFKSKNSEYEVLDQ